MSIRKQRLWQVRTGSKIIAGALACPETYTYKFNWDIVLLILNSSKKEAGDWVTIDGQTLGEWHSRLSLCCHTFWRPFKELFYNMCYWCFFANIFRYMCSTFVQSNTFVRPCVVCKVFNANRVQHVWTSGISLLCILAEYIPSCISDSSNMKLYANYRKLPDQKCRLWWDPNKCIACFLMAQ